MKRIKQPNIHLSEKGFTLLELMIATTIFSTILLLLTFGLLNIGKGYYKGKNTVRTQEVARRVMDEITQAIRYGDNPPGPITSIGGVDYVRGYGEIRKTVGGVQTIIGASDLNASHNFDDLDPNIYTLQDYFCIGSQRYIFGNKRVKLADRGSNEPAQHGLVVDTVSNCAITPDSGLKPSLPSLNLAPGRRELLAPNTRLTEFKIIKQGRNYTVTIQLTTGDDDLIVRKKPQLPTDPPFGSCRAGVDSQYCAVSRLETTVQRRRNN